MYLKIGYPRSIFDRTRTNITLFVSDPYSQPGMTSEPSRPINSINHFGGKFATHSNHWSCFDAQLVVDFFQRQCLLLAVSHTTLKCSGRRIPCVEARVGEFFGSKIL